MIFKYVEPEYDETEDASEIRASREEYERESAFLLEKIGERDDFAKLLKIAKPNKIAQIRTLLAEFDDLIEKQEKLTEMSLKLHHKLREKWRRETKLAAMREAVGPELLKHAAEHQPEKLELLEALLSDDFKSH